MRTGLLIDRPKLYYTRPDSAEDRLRLATTDRADIYGGAGNDTISVTVQEVISVDGGAGDDVISIGGGTVGFRVGANSGNDTVQVASGAELVIQVDWPGGYEVETDGSDLIVHHDGGSVRIVGYENAAAIGIASFNVLNEETAQPPDVENVLRGALGWEKLFAKSDIYTYGVEGYLNMIHVAPAAPLDLMV